MSTRLYPARRSTPRSVLAAAWLGVVGCSLTPGGPEYTELGIRVDDALKQQLADECTPLPVLPGGTVVRDFSLAPGLSAHVFAVRDEVAVTLEGTDDASSAHRKFPQPTLYKGYSDTMSVTTLDGTRYTVSFSGPCVGSEP